MLTLETWDTRRDYIIAPDLNAAISFATEHWIHSAQRAIQQRGRFAVALSGGSTPKAIYQQLSKMGSAIDWSKVWLFWCDERPVPIAHPDSNYGMTLASGLLKLPIPESQIFRMKAEGEIEKNARDYEEKIKHYLGKNLFDLVMLGVGEDGHVASLFPHTRALESEHLAAANEVPQKKSFRMTLTFPCINQSQHSAIYAFGPSKQEIVPKVLDAAIISPYPGSRIGTEQHKALWVLDSDSGKLLTIPK